MFIWIIATVNIVCTIWFSFLVFSRWKSICYVHDLFGKKLEVMPHQHTIPVVHDAYLIDAEGYRVFGGFDIKINFKTGVVTIESMKCLSGYQLVIY